MKTVIFQRNGKVIDMFEMLDVMKSIKVYTAVNEIEDDALDYYVMYFNFEIDNKHVYLVFVEPLFFKSKSDKYSVIEIGELNLDVFIEADTPEATFYNYSIEDESMEDEVMLYYLLGKFLNLDIYSLVEQDDTVFIEG
jgi:hypothetical protein